MNHLVDLPNQEHFKFIGITKNGERHECEVRKNAVGCHSVYRTADGEPCFTQLAGWENVMPKLD